MEADVNITALIDCLMQCIIFFMVIMSAQYVYGVAIKFPPPGAAKAKSEQKQEKNIVVYVQSDVLDRAADGSHYVRQDGVVKLNGEEIALAVSGNRTNWENERKRGFDELKFKMDQRLKEGYKNDILLIQGDMKTYHGKIMHVIDIAKDLKIDGFSLVPPQS